MEKQKYNHFKCRDFLLDDDFRAWYAGSAPETDHLWEALLMSNPSVKMEVNKARKLIDALNFKEIIVSESDIDLQWTKLESTILNKDLHNQAKSEKPVKGRFNFLYFFAAASFIAILGFVANHFLLSVPKTIVAKAIEKKTDNGQQLKVKLPDGTLVTLNAGSVINYPKVFADTIREVSLTGEAFFDVVPNAESPFIIHTGEVTTKVLGTSFNVRAYPENAEVQIAVVEGRVIVNASIMEGKDKNSVCLTKSEMVTIQKDEGELIVSDYDEKEQIGWKDGILYFEKSDFSATVKKLERWYGVEIQIIEKKKMDPTWRFSGRFKDKRLDYVLGVMSYPNQFSYKIIKTL